MRSIRAGLGAIVLAFEAIVLFLGSLVLYGLDAFHALGWPDWSALIAGGALILLAIVAMATVRWTVGVVLGWAVQLVVFGAGVLQPLLFVVGAMFGAIWWYAMRAGTRIDRNRLASVSEPTDS